MTFRPNPPRMVTVVIAIALLIFGVVGIFMPSLMNDAIDAMPIGKALTKQLKDVANNETLLYLSALGSSVLLAIGSLLPGI